MLNRKTMTLATLITLTLWLGGLAGCTVTVESDWPGGWGRKDRAVSEVQYSSREVDTHP